MAGQWEVASEAPAPQTQGWDVASEAPAPQSSKPGFFSTLGTDLKGLLTPTGQNPYPGMGVEQKTAAAEQSVAEDKSRKAAGYSSTYRAVAPVAESLGVNVTGMEKSAKEGDVAGVAGHMVAAAVPLAAGELTKHTGGAVGEAAGKVANTAKEVAPGYLKSADELAGTTPERISELKTVPQRMAAVHKLAVDTESSAKAAAKASYPDIKTPIIRTHVEDAGGVARSASKTLPTDAAPVSKANTATMGAARENFGKNVVQEKVSFKQVQEERAAVGEEIANEKRNVARGAPAYELKSLTAKYGQLSDEMRTAAQADGKLKDFQAAEVKWKQFQNDFHNPGSAVQPLLKLQPDQSSAIANHLLNNDKGARTLQTLRKYGADTSGVEKVLSRGSTPLKVDVTESSKLQKAGSDSNYRTQRFNEALDQATTNRLPSGTEAKLPAGAMKSKAPGIIDEIPGASIASPRNITRIKLKSALKTLSGEK